jgi:hypothetical protein
MEPHDFTTEELAAIEAETRAAGEELRSRSAPPPEGWAMLPALGAASASYSFSAVTAMQLGMLSGSVRPSGPATMSFEPVTDYEPEDAIHLSLWEA